MDPDLLDLKPRIDSSFYSLSDHCVLLQQQKNIKCNYDHKHPVFKLEINIFEKTKYKLLLTLGELYFSELSL